MPLTLVTSRLFLGHRPAQGHPERAERAEAMQRGAARFAAGGGAVEDAPPVGMAALCRVHDPAYVRSIFALTGQSAALDPDTHVSSDSIDAARHAVGASVRVVDLVLDAGEPGTRAAALVRPPGHHAERVRAMGFCLFNNVAVAAAHALARGLRRVAIVDYDVHHGNGTQAAFYENASVLFASSHQFPFYPGTGAATETGRGAGAGFTVNVPMAAGANDADYELVYEQLIVPVVSQFRPELLLLSAGFDAHVDDPLGGMRVSAGGLGRLTALLVSLADEVCEGRMAAVTEGGYDLPALEASMTAMVDALAGNDGGAPPVLGAAAPRGEAARAAAARALAPYWRL